MLLVVEFDHIEVTRSTRHASNLNKVDEMYSGRCVNFTLFGYKTSEAGMK